MELPEKKVAIRDEDNKQKIRASCGKKLEARVRLPSRTFSEVKLVGPFWCKQVYLCTSSSTQYRPVHGKHLFEKARLIFLKN